MTMTFAATEEASAEEASAEERARQLDECDELAGFAGQFYKTPGQIYLDGNSLGLLSKPAEASLLHTLNEWKTLAIGGWMDAAPPWFTLAEELARDMAPLLGASADEIIIANSTTVNLHQLLATLYRPHDRPHEANGNGIQRTKLLATALDFPSDIHAMQSQIRLRGLDPDEHLVRVPSRDGLTICEDDIIAAMTPDVHTAVLPSVLYAGGQLLDMAHLAQAARERGVLIGFDCSHSVGVAPHCLSDWDVDFAVWCSYKYLSAGPGAAGGLFLNRRHRERPGLAGWFGSRKAAQFDMAHELDPAPGAGALQIGTPPILAMAPLGGALQIVNEAGIKRVRSKSLALTAYLMSLIEEKLQEHGFTFGNPREDARRGGHIALRHPEAGRICRALREAGVVPDYRRPDIIRLAPSPLYASFAECHESVRRLRHIMDARLWQDIAPEPGLVT